jgi:heat shock protein HspQ
MIASAQLAAQFRVGQLVKHRRYGYRGVVVAVDPHCQATDEWYQSNQTRPDRRQPWYHVLVDGTGGTTYAAQTSLEEDPLLDPISHPLLSIFFTVFTGERYIRSEVPWPSSWE